MLDLQEREMGYFIVGFLLVDNSKATICVNRQVSPMRHLPVNRYILLVVYFCGKDAGSNKLQKTTLINLISKEAVGGLRRPA